MVDNSVNIPRVDRRNEHSVAHATKWETAVIHGGWTVDGSTVMP